MVIEKIYGKSIENELPLKLVDIPKPEPKKNEIRIEVTACGVCHTELDEISGRTPPTKFPIIPGHEIVGKVEKLGPNAQKHVKGERVGIAWINSSCGKCKYCRTGNENLCEDFKATGRDADGGYAEYIVVDENYAFPLPENFSSIEVAPLLCAGAVGYRALRLTNLKNGQTFGIFGFGASAHIITQVLKYKFPETKIFVFTRKGQKDHQELARDLGASWVGVTGETPPEKLDCAIDFTPAWEPVISGMESLAPGGRLVINAIRKEEKDKEKLFNMDYARDLWLEKELKTTANVARRDVEEFLSIAAEIPLSLTTQEFKLEEANQALSLLAKGKINGAAVLKIR